MTPSDKRRARQAITDYTLRCEANRTKIHYSQARPYHGKLVAPETGFTADCSSYVTLAYLWAADTSDAAVTDPNGRAYDGYGFTGTLWAENHLHRAPDGKYLVGDLALYGASPSSTRHVTICRLKGDRASSVWSSHGSEQGPLPTRIGYRSDLLAVLRPHSFL